MLVSAGTWNFKASDKGLHLFRYHPEDGTMEFLHHYDPELSAGSQAYNPANHMLYIGDECVNHPGERGGGGFVRAYRVDEESGELTFVNESRTLLPKPAYLCLNASGTRLLVACHSDRGFVTRVSHDAEGNWTSTVEYDDSGIVLMKIDDDGSVGAGCYVALHEGLAADPKQVLAHPHSVVGSPDREIYFACDKGLDRIFSYKLSKDENKLIPLCQTEMEPCTAPRYSAFHPTLPVWYENNEEGNRLYAFRYEKASGVLEKVSVTELFDPASQSGSPSDLAVHPNGRYLYAAVRGLNEIVILDIDPGSGGLTLREKVALSGSPRGIALSPDGRFLLAADNDGGRILVCAVAEDGSLTAQDRAYPVLNAANLLFLGS